MARFSATGSALWSVIRQSRLYQMVLFILLPLLVIFQFSIDFTGLQTLSTSYIESTYTVRNSALERLTRNESSSIAGPKRQPYRLTVCAVVHNEVPYLVEWIEFHRLQGADHFVLYNYLGQDLVEYLPMLYEAHQSNVTIRVLPARFYGKSPEESSFEETAQLAMVDCYVQYRPLSLYLLFTTGGHFTYSPKHESIWGFLQQNAGKATGIRIPTAKFGTSGWQAKFRTWLSPNSYSGSVDLLYEPSENATDNYPFVLLTNKMRAPHRQLDKAEIQLEECKPEDKKRIVACSETSPVTLISGSRYCVKSNMSECLSPQTDTLTPPMDALRSDDHTWRSTAHVNQLMAIKAILPAQFQVLDSSWYSRVEDTLKSDKYGAQVEQRLMALRPKVFVEVGRECEEGALTRGQQMMCPASHPFPYGLNGVKYLRNCCQKDVDVGNKALTVQSGNCWNDSYVECNEPVGTQKWLHRSCCVYNEHSHKQQVIISA